jgi:hypothetical protein
MDRVSLILISNNPKPLRGFLLYYQNPSLRIANDLATYGNLAKPLGMVLHA